MSLVDCRERTDAQEETEDIFSSSLQSLYDLTPFSQSSPGCRFTYNYQPLLCFRPSTEALTNEQTQIVLFTPNPSAANWSLHASSIWIGALFLSDHLQDLCLPNCGYFHVLELGAGAGLPSILIAKLYHNATVVTTDYPDDQLIGTLRSNILRNGVEERCFAIPYAWGTDGRCLYATRSSMLRGADEHAQKQLFDVIVSSDTLFNPANHPLFIETLCMTLRRSPHARIYLVSGLHTGRYTIQSFIDAVCQTALEIVSAVEREASGERSRAWDVKLAEGEDEVEKRRWIVWLELQWRSPA